MGTGMTRKALFADDRVFEAVGRLMASQGAVTTSAIQQAAKLSTGSLYHRFGSREGLLAETWLFALRAFQPHFVKALETPGIRVGEIAVVTPRFCREQRATALILACCSYRQFMNDDTPIAIRRRIHKTNATTFGALNAFVRRHGFNPDASRLGLVSFPLAAVRHYLPDHEVPQIVDKHVAVAAEAVLACRR